MRFIDLALFFLCICSNITLVRDSFFILRSLLTSPSVQQYHSEQLFIVLLDWYSHSHFSLEWYFVWEFGVRHLALICSLFCVSLFINFLPFLQLSMLFDMMTMKYSFSRLNLVGVCCVFVISFGGCAYFRLLTRN